MALKVPPGHFPLPRLSAFLRAGSGHLQHLRGLPPLPVATFLLLCWSCPYVSMQPLPVVELQQRTFKSQKAQAASRALKF